MTEGAATTSALAVLWGKSDHGSGANLLLQHLLDTAAVAECLWDHYLSDGLRRSLDRIAGGTGGGRQLLAFLCGVHDLGKATPAFQAQQPDLAQAVWAAGLQVEGLPPRAARTWRHEVSGAKALLDAMTGAGWPRPQRSWVWPVIAGHHGRFPAKAALGVPPSRGPAHGDARWHQVRQGVIGRVVQAVGANGLDALCPEAVPSRSVQLTISGVVIMADWIASQEELFTGVFNLDRVTMPAARDRARAGWAALALDGGWRKLEPGPAESLVDRRFGYPPRPVQATVLDAVQQMPRPGLVVVEAPTGEGKTEAALAAAEILAARSGASGVFIGMPSQATADQMFRRTREWVAGVSPGRQMALLHGRRRFSRAWTEMAAPSGTDPADVPLDEYGQPEFGHAPAGVAEDGPDPDAATAAAEWFLGAKRGLLAPVVIGTIDQLLFAATRTRHVVLRHAGLSSKVVVLDEIHAADVYMYEFVAHALRWLGQGGVPAVLLSATLSPAQRQRLVDSYLQGATGETDLRAELPTAGYPAVTTCSAAEDTPIHVEVATAETWRPSRRVSVEILAEDPGDPDGRVAELVAARTRDGGCVLVIRNTVSRAQQTYQRLVDAMDDDIVLLHSRLVAGDRADRTAHAVEALGPAADARPRRLTIVATQVAEQSFDIDVDLLITDLAPVDLLIQRIGRLHRHDRPGTARPSALRAPRVVVTGMDPQPEGPPRIDVGTQAVYPPALLLRTAAQVARAESDGWLLPSQAPALVAEAYGTEGVVPPSWRAELSVVEEAWMADGVRRAALAGEHLLVPEGHWTARTLAGLHDIGSTGSAGDDELRARVRDGEDTLAVVLLRRTDRGMETMNRKWLGLAGEHGPAVVDDVLAGTVRLPARLTGAGLDLGTLPEWQDRPPLRWLRVLVLNSDGVVGLDGHHVRYDGQLGLTVERAAGG